MGGDDALASERTPIISVPRRLPARQNKQGPPNHQGGANTSVMAFFAACGAMLSMFLVVSYIGPSIPKDLAALSSASAESAAVFERVGRDGVEVVWQRPPTSTPRGTLFLAHGCNHAATDFFPRSERCRHCVGLPEETSLVDKALKRGYAVVAVSSVGRCWSGATDGPRVKSALDALFAKNTNAPLVGKPVFAFGASSGGAFVGILPFITSVDGIIAQISSVRLPKLSDKSSLTQELRAQGGRGDFPPVVFSRMSRDELTGKLVDSAKTYLEGMEVPVRVTVLKPLPIHEQFFSERVRGQGRQGGEVSPAEGAAEDAVDAETSAAMARALRRAELVDESGYLKEDPRASEWREVLAPMARTDSLQPDKSALSEVLNVAYALHELSADGFDEDVAWLEAKAAAAKAARLGLGGDAAAAKAAAGGKTDKAGVVVTPPRRAAAEAEAAA